MSKNEAEQETKLTIKRVLGVSKPFAQGKSLVVTIPHGAVEGLHLRDKLKGGYFGFIFAETNHGLLLVPLDKVANPETVRSALRFVDTSDLSDEDLEFLSESEE